MCHRMTGSAIVLLIFLLSFGSTACADTSVNLFAEHGPDQRKTWKSTGVIHVEEASGGPVFRIETDERNDLSLTREIPVDKGAYYRFSARIRTENVRGPVGANLGIYGTYNHTSGISGDHDWTEVSEVFRAVESDIAPFALRLGYWDAPSAGTAWFQDVQVEKLDNWRGFYQAIEKTPPKGPLWTLPFRALIFFFLVPFALFCLAWLRNGWFSQGSNDLASGRPLRRHRGFWALLAAALLVRLVMAPYQGMSADIAYLKSLALQLGVGPDLFLAFFQGDNPQGLTLLSTYLLAGIGSLVRALNWEASQFFVILLKMPAILCELGLVALILQVLRKWGAGKKAWLCGALMAFHPVLLMLTPFWGQLTIIQATFLLAGVLALLDRRPLAAGLLFGLGFSTDIRFVLLALLLVGAAARLCGRNAAFKTVLGCCLSGLILSLPELSGGGELWLSHILPPQLGALTAFNAWTVSGLNWESLTTPAWIAGIGLGIGLFAAALWCIPRRSRGATEENLRLQTLIVFSLFAAALFLFLPGMQARFLLPSLIFLIPALGLGTRHRWTFFLLSLFLFFNLAHVFWDSAYLGQRPSADSPGIRIVAGLLGLLWLVAVMFEAWQRGRRKVKAVAKRGKEVREDIAQPFDPGPLQSQPFKIRVGDWIALLLITILGAGLIFFRIGEWDFPTRGLTIQQESATFEVDLGTPREIAKAGFFGGEIAPEIRFLKQEEGRWQALWSRRDGLLYYYTRQDYRKTFKNAERSFPPVTADKLRLIVYGENATVNEIVLFDTQSLKITPEKVRSLASDERVVAAQHPFFDEPEKANLIGSFRTKTYWDEVFYARSAYDLVNRQEPYERTHPPFGKTLISLGVFAFDMTPFGWRFASGVCMASLPLIIFFGARNLTRRRTGAYLAALLMIFEGLLYTVGRMANIDGFLLLFTTLMFLSLFFWYSADHGLFTRRNITWFLAGGFFAGLAVSTKWSAVFFGFSVFVLVFGWKVLQGWIALKEEKNTQNGAFFSFFTNNFIPRLVAWCACFLLLPSVIYYLSHAPYIQSLPERPAIASEAGFKEFLDQQEYILSFHGGSKVGDTHSLSSPFYEWPLMTQPVTRIFVQSDLPDAKRSSISMVGNPIIFWSGIAVMSILLWRAFRGRDQGAILLSAAYFISLLPWILVERPSFFYAYAPFIPLLVLGISYFACSTFPGQKAVFWAAGYLIIAVAVFLIIFPAVSGLPVFESYFSFLRLFPGMEKV